MTYTAVRPCQQRNIHGRIRFALDMTVAVANEYKNIIIIICDSSFVVSGQKYLACENIGLLLVGCVSMTVLNLGYWLTSMIDCC